MLSVSDSLGLVATLSFQFPDDLADVDKNIAVTRVLDTDEYSEDIAFEDQEQIDEPTVELPKSPLPVDLENMNHAFAALQQRSNAAVNYLNRALDESDADKEKLLSDLTTAQDIADNRAHALDDAHKLVKSLELQLVDERERLLDALGSLAAAENCRLEMSAEIEDQGAIIQDLNTCADSARAEYMVDLNAARAHISDLQERLILKEVEHAKAVAESQVRITILEQEIHHARGSSLRSGRSTEPAEPSREELTRELDTQVSLNVQLSQRLAELEDSLKTTQAEKAATDQILIETVKESMAHKDIAVRLGCRVAELEAKLEQEAATRSQNVQARDMYDWVAITPLKRSTTDPLAAILAGANDAELRKARKLVGKNAYHTISLRSHRNAGFQWQTAEEKENDASEIVSGTKPETGGQEATASVS